MCGILGVLTLPGSNFAVDERYLTRMRDTMEHRGPDGAGLWIAPDRRVGLGHRRLSIVDLSTAANQPMSNEDDSVWVVFNGEIYNHAEIRQELEKLGGHRWKTDHSDTEVILHAYEQWGIECLQRFRGMFGIGIWDARQQQLWLVRDRLGVKPLYWSMHHGRLTFASEVKALLADPDQARAVNEESLYHYLTFVTVPPPNTLFEGIYKLPPGTWMRVTAKGQITQQCYWDVWDHTQSLTGASDDEIAERLRAGLRESVRLRTVSDVPIGIFLSGGVDSSTNAAMYSEIATQPVHTFTVGYKGENPNYPNETHFARMMADKIGSNHHELMLSMDELLAFLPQMIHLQDDAIGLAASFPTYFLAKLARDCGVKVCQLGEGSDELFWGYRDWKARLNLQRAHDWPVPLLAKKGLLKAKALFGMNDSYRAEALRRAAAGQHTFWGGSDAIPDSRKQRLISPRLRTRFAGLTSWEVLRPIWNRFRASAWEPSNVHWMTYADLNIRLPELLLLRMDKMCMGVGVEAREPFMDHKFVELALSIPKKVKTRHGTIKHILKHAVRGLIPDALIDRRKQCLLVPIHDWFTNSLGHYAHAEVASFCRRTDLFDSGEVQRLIQKRETTPLWLLLNFALWHRHWIEGQQDLALAG